MRIRESVLAKTGLAVLGAAALGTIAFWPISHEGDRRPPTPPVAQSPGDPGFKPFIPDLTWFGVPKDPNRPIPPAVGTLPMRPPPAAAANAPAAAPPAVTDRPAQSPPAAAPVPAPPAPAAAPAPATQKPPLIGVGANVPSVLGLGLGVG